jgi:hypothetical protein
MYCTNCGAWNQEESEFCANCGRPLGEKKSQRKSGPGLCLLLALGLVVVLIAAGVLAYNQRNRIAKALVGYFVASTPTIVIPTVTPTQLPPTATTAPSATPKPTVAQPSFKLLYKQCVPHGSGLGSVKGQVFDKSGKVIPGAKVRIRINDYDWESAANPATTNAEGWFEWTLEAGQKVKFMELIVAGRSVPFAPQGFEVKAQGGCFQRVDFVEQ